VASAAFGVLHFAPPQSQGATDRRMQAFIAALGRAQSPQSTSSQHPHRFRRAAARENASMLSDGRTLPLVYASTTGVYGDCGGALIDETQRVRPTNARAIRRVSAERQLRDACLRGSLSPSILRIPGIYARTRLPEARLRRGTPVLRPEDDVYTSHIQADELAAIAVRTLWRGRSQRLYHACDDSRLRMGAYFALVADALGLPHPPEITRAEAERVIEPSLMSFMRESRQLRNHRLKRELAYTLRYPSVAAFLATLPSAPEAQRAPGVAPGPAAHVSTLS
jgi:nucleoside-diphosphate-sugar epimerase